MTLAFKPAKTKDRQPTKREQRAAERAAERQRAWDETMRREREARAVREWQLLCEYYEVGIESRSIHDYAQNPTVAALTALLESLTGLPDTALLDKIRAERQTALRALAAAELEERIESAFERRNEDERAIITDWRRYNADSVVNPDNPILLPDPGITEDRFELIRERLDAIRQDPPGVEEPREERNALRMLCRARFAADFEGHVLPENLLAALKMVKPFVASRPRLAVLGNVKIAHPGKGKYGHNQIDLEATNLEIQIRVSVGCRRAPLLDTTVPADRLTEWIALADDEPLALLAWSDNLAFMQRQHYATFKAISTDDFPIFPEMPPVQFTIRDITAFRQVCRLTAAAVKHDQWSLLTGVNVVYNPESALVPQFEMAASDGYKIVERSVEVEPAAEAQALNIIVPGRTLDTLAKILPDEKTAYLDPLQIAVDGTSVYFAWGNVTVRSQLIEGTYPAYRSVVPTKFDAVTTVYLDELQRAVKKFKGYHFLDLEVKPSDSPHAAPGELRLTTGDTAPDDALALDLRLDCRTEYGFKVTLSKPLLQGILSELDKANPAKGKAKQSREITLSWSKTVGAVVFHLGEAQSTLMKATRPDYSRPARPVEPPPAEGYQYGRDLEPLVNDEWKMQAHDERQAMLVYDAWLKANGLKWRCTDDLIAAIYDAVQ